MTINSGDVDVLIVGAGPTGLTLACDLARREVNFRLVDKASSYFNGSRGKGLQPRTLEVMDDLGVVDRIVSLGEFHIPFRGYDGTTLIGEKDPHQERHATSSTPYASPLILPQWRVEETLRGLLERRGGVVELSTALTSLEQDEGGVRATLQTNRGDEEIRCRYLVAADGGRSFVRKSLAVPFEGETWTEERMYVGDVLLRGLDRKAWHSWPYHPDGWLALCPLPSTHAFQLQAQIQAGKEQGPSLELFQELVRERTGGMDIELLSASWLSLYHPQVRMASRFRVGRVFLAGDAAHVHSPAGGQGMNTGIQDSYNLGWKLESVLKGAPEGLLETYEEERLPVAANVLGISTKLYRQITTDSDDSLRRDAVTLQLGITYKQMSLSKRMGDGALKISSGDRAPDASGLGADGKPLRLFDALRGPRFTLLRLFPGDRALGTVDLRDVSIVDIVASNSTEHTGTTSLTFVDAFDHAAEAYGADGGALLLIRPDGYVGWIGTTDGLDDLHRYLAVVSPRL
jgi:2-polyprenyl-6-methoxyphenol hydroxylase-like FAD-dependent oxidoreductase